MREKDRSRAPFTTLRRDAAATNLVQTVAFVEHPDGACRPPPEPHDAMAEDLGPLPAHVKACSSCKAPIERISNCDHIVSSPHSEFTRLPARVAIATLPPQTCRCKHQFCWQCLTSHLGHTPYCPLVLPTPLNTPRGPPSTCPDRPTRTGWSVPTRRSEAASCGAPARSSGGRQRTWRGGRGRRPARWSSGGRSGAWREPSLPPPPSAIAMPSPSTARATPPTPPGLSAPASGPSSRASLWLPLLRAVRALDAAVRPREDRFERPGYVELAEERLLLGRALLLRIGGAHEAVPLLQEALKDLRAANGAASTPAAVALAAASLSHALAEASDPGAASRAALAACRPLQPGPEPPLAPRADGGEAAAWREARAALDAAAAAAARAPGAAPPGAAAAGVPSCRAPGAAAAGVPSCRGARGSEAGALWRRRWARRTRVRRRRRASPTRGCDLQEAEEDGVGALACFAEDALLAPAPPKPRQEQIEQPYPSPASQTIPQADLEAARRERGHGSAGAALPAAAFAEAAVAAGRRRAAPEALEQAEAALEAAPEHKPDAELRDWGAASFAALAARAALRHPDAPLVDAPAELEASA
eukprot:tig00021493_g21903.t1